MKSDKSKEKLIISEEDQKILDELQVNTKDLTESSELKISELDNKIYFPYTKQDLVNKIVENKDTYSSIDEIINTYFVKSRTPYKNHPAVMRFKAVYHLLHNKENKSRGESFRYASKFMIRRDLNPAIIDALKSSEELDKYLECIKNVSFEKFDLFTIIFEVHPLSNL